MEKNCSSINILFRYKYSFVGKEFEILKEYMRLYKEKVHVSCANYHMYFVFCYNLHAEFSLNVTLFFVIAIQNYTMNIQRWYFLDDLPIFFFRVKQNLCINRLALLKVTGPQQSDSSRFTSVKKIIFIGYESFLQWNQVHIICIPRTSFRVVQKSKIQVSHRACNLWFISSYFINRCFVIHLELQRKGCEVRVLEKGLEWSWISPQPV